MAVSGQALVAVPQSSSPSVITPGNATSQQILMQAMMKGLPQDQQAQVAQAMQAAAVAAANQYYLECTIRKLAPALTNGAVNQAYAMATPLTFALTTALNGFCEGILIRMTVNYTLAAGTSAVYGLTAAGLLGLIDTVEVRYNRSQHKVRPFALRQVALTGGLEDYTLPNAVLTGQHQTWLDTYINTAMPVATGAQSVTFELFIPFNLLGRNDPRGLLPIIVGDTGIQVVVNTPQAIFGAHPFYNSLYAVSGTGHAVSAVSGTVSVDAVYRDGDSYMGAPKLPFDMSAVQGTFQMQIDQQLLPWVAGSYQRTKLQVMGQHAYVLLLCVDGLQANQCMANSNIAYIEFSKDGVGANVFEKYGTQTNLNVGDFFYMKRLNFTQDLDQGVIPWIHGPVVRQGDPHIRTGRQFLDNSRNGWPDARFCVTPTAVGNGTLNGLPVAPMIEPHLFYLNPVGLVSV